MRRRAISVFMAATLVSGCAIHPLPEDVTGAVTEQIVRQIRCETQESLRSIIIRTLDETGDPDLRVLAATYAENHELTREFSPKIFNSLKYALLKSIVTTFYGTAVAYNFDFDMYEDNNVSGGLDVLKPLTGGALTFGFNLSANKKREVERSFTISDTFETALKLPVRYCKGQLATENYAYPIAGKIGVEPVLRTFIALTLFGGLSAAVDKAASKPPAKTAAVESHTAAKKVEISTLGGPPALAEMLAFTTTISASATPKLTFSPVGKSLQVMDANISGVADRTDIHKVTLGLAIDPGKVVDIDPLRLQFYGTGSGGLIIGRRVLGGGTPAQQLAVLAIDQLKRDRVNLRIDD